MARDESRLCQPLPEPARGCAYAEVCARPHGDCSAGGQQRGALGQEIALALVTAVAVAPETVRARPASATPRPGAWDVAGAGPRAGDAGACAPHPLRDGARRAKNELTPWRRVPRGYPPARAAAFAVPRAAVRNLYSRPYAARYPVIGRDEQPKPRRADRRTPAAARPGRPATYDYAYVETQIASSAASRLCRTAGGYLRLGGGQTELRPHGRPPFDADRRCAGRKRPAAPVHRQYTVSMSAAGDLDPGRLPVRTGKGRAPA